MEGGNEVSEANGITHSPLGELNDGITINQWIFGNAGFSVRLRRRLVAGLRPFVMHASVRFSASTSAQQRREPIAPTSTVLEPRSGQYANAPYCC